MSEENKKPKEVPKAASDAPASEGKEAKASIAKKPNLVYAALLLHSSGKEITETNVKKIADAAELDVDETQIKALVAALDGIDIEDAIANAVSAAPASVASESKASDDAKDGEDKKEEESEEQKEKKAEEAAEGLGALFG